MKRMLWTLLTITFLAGVSGCCWPPCPRLPGCILGCGRPSLPGTCGQCGGAGCESCSGGSCENCGGAGCENCGPAGCQSDSSVACESCGGAGCEACNGVACGRCGRPRAAACGFPGRIGSAGREADQFTPGPPTGTITYPYYTNRGPRDFLAKNPPSIGP